MQTSLVITKEKLDSYTPFLKDYLCKLYRYVNIHFKANDVIEQFSELHVLQAIRNLSMSGSSNFDVNVARRFLVNLDLIKELVENQPSKTIEYGFMNYIDDDSTKEKVFCKRGEITESTYNLAEMDNRFSFRTRGCEVRIISTKNLELTDI